MSQEKLKCYVCGYLEDADWCTEFYGKVFCSVNCENEYAGTDEKDNLFIDDDYIDEREE